APNGNEQRPFTRITRASVSKRTSLPHSEQLECDRPNSTYLNSAAFWCNATAIVTASESFKVQRMLILSTKFSVSFGPVISRALPERQCPLGSNASFLAINSCRSAETTKLPAVSGAASSLRRLVRAAIDIGALGPFAALSLANGVIFC